MTSYRLAQGGLIDRSQRLGFSFDGRRYDGHPGDTLASALLANGVRLTGRSFKYHRPRGILSAGSEEPNALVELRSGGRHEPNTRATMVELYDGLAANSQNRWPSLAFDALGVVNSLLSPVFPAGFYYKTFMWPASFWEPVYERIIRRAAGLGTAPKETDPDRYERRHAFCDVLVVGGGPAGLSAALAAADSGARIILCDENDRLGGALLGESEPVEGQAAADWVAGRVAALQGFGDRVTLVPRGTAFGIYDHGTVGLVERVADHLAEPPPHLPRQRFWTIRAAAVVVAAGAIEQPLVFPNNDRPGVMLANAVRRYANRYAVAPGKRVLVAGIDDGAARTALDLKRHGVDVAGLVDARPDPAGPLAEQLHAAGIPVHAGSTVRAARGKLGVDGARIGRLDGEGKDVAVDCDAIAISAGWMPTAHLLSQRGIRPHFDGTLGSFVMPELDGPLLAAGACAGRAGTEVAIADGLAIGRLAARVAKSAGAIPKRVPPPLAGGGEGEGVGAADRGSAGPSPASTTPSPYPPPAGGGGTRWARPAPSPATGPAVTDPQVTGKAFVDFQNDVTAADIRLAAREGYTSPEHMKRYTTQGMATDQGKTSNGPALGVLAEARHLRAGDLAAPTFRPPYTPVAFGAIAGRSVGWHAYPTRRPPFHEIQRADGAVFIRSGGWLRPHYYPRPGESLGEASLREARYVRSHVGVFDVSTLGKVDVNGPDAAAFLERLYVNRIETLPVGRSRYGIMLRDDGIVLDDGTVTRLAEDRFYVTTTSAKAHDVVRMMERLTEVDWPELRVAVTELTEARAALALTGPQARDVLARLVGDAADVSNEALPFMAARDVVVDGLPIRILRVSFTGELGYELHVEAQHAHALWHRLMAAGEPIGLQRFGLEALELLRIEKGFLTGAEINGQVTLADLAHERFAKREGPYIGKPMAQREGLADPDRPRLVGLVSEGGAPLVAGAHLVEGGMYRALEPTQGHVTSSCTSPVTGLPIGLGFLARAKERTGGTIFATDPLRGSHIQVRVVEPCMYDPKGERVRD
ncbi:sarcosine oxidase subunit alpha [Inquilinus ginsengisoli]|uniref:Sarcosine oxidase subunit alpha n=1 Tax=Inquilinus ginsengisoli TaxID=363840 RepID=A0ABU1JL91_9PROT|nr:2Fe-2S iron-sulfur cluster-binding protein [Inquilinus ginsengisoli]MDR6289389.1 sarcosine oxidase subunit alpha [Inquilinus ginsengisoli]